MTGLGGLGASLQAQITQCPGTAAVRGLLVEMEVAGYAWDGGATAGDGVICQEWWVANTLLSTGLTPTFDVQLGFDGWAAVTANDHGVKTTVRGLGDMWIRAKWNFAGNPNEGPAWAWLPYVKVPTASNELGNGQWEPGLALVFGRPLPARSWLAAMLSYDSLSDEFGGRADAYFFSTAVGHESGWYGELTVSHDRTCPGETPVNLGLGYTFAVNETLSGDLEVLGGANREAGDLAIVARIVWAR